MIGCNKKVTETMNGEFHCEKCNKTFPTVRLFSVLSSPRLILLSYLTYTVHSQIYSQCEHGGSLW